MYAEDGRQDIVYSDATLLSAAELDRFMNSEAGGKKLKWINHFQPINDPVVN